MAKMTFKDRFDIKKEMLGNVEELKANLPRFMKETVVDNSRETALSSGFRAAWILLLLPLLLLKPWGLTMYTA